MRGFPGVCCFVRSDLMKGASAHLWHFLGTFALDTLLSGLLMTGLKIGLVRMLNALSPSQ